MSRQKEEEPGTVAEGVANTLVDCLQKKEEQQKDH